MTETLAMANPKDEILEALKALDWDQSQLVREVRRRTGRSVARATVNRIVNDETTNPRDGTVDLLLRTLKQAVIERERELPLDDGLPVGSDHDPRRLPDYQRSGWIPEIGAVPAGSFLDTSIQLQSDKALPPSLYPYPEEYPAIIRAKGDSMAPLINSGDAVVIARRFWREPKTGDIVVITRTQDEDHTIKHLEILDDGRWRLIPRNQDHPTITLKRDRIRAAAVVVGWYRPHYVTLGRPAKKP